MRKQEVYVNHLSFGGRDAVAATLSNDFIHLVDIEAKKSKQTLDVAKRVIDPSQTPHVISVFDLRKCTDPVLTIKESHSDSINTLAFMRDGRHLISGGSDGLLNIFNASYGKEDQALQSTCSVGSSIARAGCLSKRLIYACTDDNKCSVFVPNSPDDVDYLFIVICFRSITPIYDYDDFRRNGVEGRFLVDALKGGVDERPVALLECDPEGTLYVRTVSKDGKNSEVVMEWKGHTDIVRSAAYNNRLLVTGGEDGKIVVKNVDLRPEGGKAEKRKDKQDDEKNNSKHKDKKRKRSERLESLTECTNFCGIIV
ncbi:WD domain, G-beta repeat protein [Ancylostoma ceylanicum]|uniref:WD repeat-containing protein 89 n=1 Tax=Ancylostoma ceylanicum TaxID=53326 RepID=A0A0D6M7X0_9BILA|nr:WD domain, G-beta repeat protein [Ancylostoma ceylanicum]